MKISHKLQIPFIDIYFRTTYYIIEETGKPNGNSEGNVPCHHRNQL